MGVLDEWRRTPWRRAWKLTVGLAGLYLLGSLGFAGLVLVRVDESQGHAGGFAAIAAVLFAVVGVAVFVGALAVAWVLRRGVAKLPVSVGVMVAGWLVYRASGYFEGFVPVFIGAVAVGVLGSYEAVSERR